VSGFLGCALMNENNFIKKILLVSDNLADIRRIQRLFMDTGGLECKLYPCTRIEAAVEQLNNNKLSFDIIILDLRLENNASFEGGFETLFSHITDLPIIVLTGDSQDEQASALPVIADGAFAQIHKDSLASLVRIISDALYPRVEE
jgi:CheY-like chemotaxis protein